MSTPTAPTGATSSATPSVSSAPKSSTPATSPQKSSVSPAPSASSSSPSSNAPSAQGSQTVGKSMADIAASKLAGNTQSAPTQAPAAEAPQGEKIAPVANETAEQRAFRIKVNGQDRELSPDQARRYAQLGFAADEKFQEATKLRQSAEALFRALKTDPMSVLTNPELGIDFRKISEQFLSKELEREMMPPEQRELAELREFKAKQEEAAKAAETEKLTQAQKEAQAEQTKRAAAKYNAEISEALQKSDLPRSPETLKRVAQLLYNARQKNYDLDSATAVEMVREGYQAELRSLVGKMEPEAMIKFFGDDMVKRIRQYDLARLKRQLSGEAAPEVSQPEQAPEQVKPTTTARRKEPASQGGLRSAEWIENLRRKANITE